MPFLSTMFGKIVATFLVSMVPIIELRGAIPIGIGYGLDYWVVVTVSVIGNILPVPFIILFIRKIFELMRKWSKKLDSLVSKLEKRAHEKSDVVQKYAFWGLFVLVAIPLPGTGAWTGALVAAMLDMRLKRAFPAIALGVITAATIVTFVTYGADKLFF
ncbi:MAG: small multi-drug export protein [Clostridia bacterium]|nr:small multi-drug export protein [Clostridia bacterium]